MARDLDLTQSGWRRALGRLYSLVSGANSDAIKAPAAGPDEPRDERAQETRDVHWHAPVDPDQYNAKQLYADDGGPDGGPIYNSLEVTGVSDELGLCKVIERYWNDNTNQFDEKESTIDFEQLQYRQLVLGMHPTRTEAAEQEAEIQAMTLRDQEEAERAWHEEFAGDEWEPLPKDQQIYVSYLIAENPTNSCDNDSAYISIEEINGRGEVRVVTGVSNSWTDAESATETVMSFESAKEQVASYRQSAAEERHAGERFHGERDSNVEIDDPETTWNVVPEGQRKGAEYASTVWESGRDVPVMERSEIIAHSGKLAKVLQSCRYEATGEIFSTTCVLPSTDANELISAYRARAAINTATLKQGVTNAFQP